MKIFSDIMKIPKSIVFAMRGILHAYKTDKSFRLEIYLGLPIYLILGWWLRPFLAWELALFVFSYLLILIVELVNTAFESALDHLHPQRHERVGATKDIASGAVLLAFVFAAVVLALLLYSRCIGAIDDSSLIRVFV